MGVTEAGVTRLVGFDNSGEVFLAGDRLLRGIYPGEATAVRRVLAVCEDNGFFDGEIVSTREAHDNPLPELGYEAVLEHERIPFVSYPHEWSASMLQDAARFHVQLFLRLGRQGLTLKDWHPYNVLFDGTTPRFVDFTSIVPLESLAAQGYLKQATAPPGFARLWDATAVALYFMYRITCEPYFVLPLAMMSDRRYAAARKRLFETALNATPSNLSRGEVFAGNLAGRLSYELGDLALRLALVERGPFKKRFFERVAKSIAGIRVAPGGSAYSSYYTDKREAFSTAPSEEWTSKQRSVHETLVMLKPDTILDLGSNTGWFSILAARLGCSVVAVDVDDACIDSLYRFAKRDKLRILPLVANLAEPTPDLRPRLFDDEPSLSRLGGDEPLYTSPDKRLQCDMVMALAVLHHLILGQGLSFERAGAIFAGLARKHLCVEFVELSDEMIVSEPEFFPAWNSAPNAFAWYTLENLIAELRRHFRQIEVKPSFPATRKLVVCSR